MDAAIESAQAIQEAWTLLTQLYWQEVRPQVTRVASQFGLTPPQLFALRALDGDEPIPMGDLAQRLRCDNSNVTGLIDGLAAQGLVERHASAHDRRVRMLVVTERGAEVRACLASAMRTVPPQLAGLSDADQRALRDILRRAAGV